MPRSLIVPLCAIPLILLSVAVAPAQNAAPSPTVQANNAFAFDLYGHLAPEPGNLFLSPYSINNALAMTYDGARGNTAVEMKKVLRFTQEREALNASFADLTAKIQNDTKRKYQLKVANRLFGQKDFGFLPPFLEVTKKSYGAGLEEVDFKSATEQARQKINSWVEKQTNDKIKNLIQPGVLTSDSRLVLANAIYFKAAWSEEFVPQATKPAAFTTLNAQKKQVPTMHANKQRRFYQDDAMALLELPYQQHELSMFIALPKDAAGLPALEKELSADKFAGWVGKMTNYQVDVKLPKYKVTSQFSLKKTLAALGMVEAFTDAADFSGIASGSKLSISEVVHKAFVDVDENGTEAAAATAVVIGLTSMPAAPPKSANFYANHPFFYVIRDNRTGAILFMGRVIDPS